MTCFARLEYAMSCMSNTVLRSRATGGSGRVGGNDRPRLRTWDDGRGTRSEIRASCTARRGHCAPAESMAARWTWCTRGDGIEHVQLNLVGRLDVFVPLFGSICVISHHWVIGPNILRNHPSKSSFEIGVACRQFKPEPKWLMGLRCGQVVGPPFGPKARDREGNSPGFSYSGSSADGEGLRSNRQTDRQTVWAAVSQARPRIIPPSSSARGACGSRRSGQNSRSGLKPRLDPTQSFGGYAGQWRTRRRRD
jgi:hypothetical protein